MTAPHAEQIIAGYLARLDAALTGVGRDAGAELRADVTAHIADARAELDGESDADLLNILDRLGEPSALVAEGLAAAGASTAAGVPAGEAGPAGPGSSPAPGSTPTADTTRLLAFAALTVMIAMPLFLPFSILTGGPVILGLLLAHSSKVWRRTELVAAFSLPLLSILIGFLIASAMSRHWAVFFELGMVSFILVPSAIYLILVAGRRGWRAPATV
ncbi:MAG TPA: hypothetical protein VG245_03000 [Candidatus Dormibacteraeota bacterium]|jgi:hypothetical protein|nr:hypothetical protein [Candidatus Dormibacteraeota bacterium]